MQSKLNQIKVISGPCSAETLDQVLETSLAIKKTQKVQLLRFGIWKPRTQPGNFEGVGIKALPWLIEAKSMTGLPVSIEVGSAKHVEMALGFGIDVLWIGARSTSNPFIVQDIAEALKGVKEVPILIKNPINPDVSLWKGAVERFKKSGIEDLGLIHRGFSTLNYTKYRNEPLWSLALDMISQYADLPIYCDPSHICGNRKDIELVSKKALDLGYHGLMIESHMLPDKAWSDAKQQITPFELENMLNTLDLHLKQHKSNNLNDENLTELRAKIQIVDEMLIKLLKDRMELSKSIGCFKRKAGLPILQPSQWKLVLDSAINLSNDYNLNTDFTKDVMYKIHCESLKVQSTD